MTRALSLLIVLLLSAGGARAEDIKVAIGQKGFWDTSITAWGDRAGFFREQGLTLDILYTEGGAETQQAVISGGVDIGIGAGTLGVLGAALKGAPVRAIAAEWTGASDLYWYARGDSPVRSLKDAAGRSVGFSTTGSSSNLVLLTLLEAAGVQARPTATGGAGATLTQVMSGQIDIGWSVVPIGLADVDAGRIRIVARGTDVGSLAGQTTRVNIANARLLHDHRDVVERFARGYAKSLAWAYADTQAVTWFAEGLKIDPALARRARDDYYRRAAMEPGTIHGLDATLRQAVDLKRVPPATTIDQARAMIDIVTGDTP